MSQGNRDSPGDSPPPTHIGHRPSGPRGLAVRPEEKLLIAVLAVGILLCLSSGTGFFPWNVFKSYFSFFGQYLVYLFLLTRSWEAIRMRWRPKSRTGTAVLRWLGGPGDANRLLRLDLEFLRGFLPLLFSLTVYSNVKIRIPFLRASLSDEYFLALDNAIFGASFAPWLERVVAARPAFAEFLARVYFHDYVWMVVLVVWFWMQYDVRRMRWLFSSVCFLYLCGIYLTVLAPSFGPFFFDPERYSWLRGTVIGEAQAMLIKHFVYSMDRASQGESISNAAFIGIAAFPSLHVAHMVLLSVIGWKTARPFAIFTIGVAIVTTIATVAFGWHYAIDAIGGALLAIAVALGVGRIITRGAPASGASA